MTSYDLKGRRTNTSTFDPNGTLVRSLDTSYDARDRVNSVNNGGSITQTVFDAVGELVSETNPKNATTTHQYDARARMLKTVDALSGNTGYTYDLNGRRTNTSAFEPSGAFVRSLDTICEANTTLLRMSPNCHARCAALCL